MPYDAFISYSHAADGQLAPALQTALHRFAKPWFRKRAVHLFRDQTSLTASPGLWPAIEAALSQSRYFLLLASPEAAASRWVQQEVGWWLEHRSPDTLLIALTDGVIARDESADDFDWDRTDALPPNLRGAFVENPLWVDFRWAQGPAQLSLNHPEFKNALAALAAPLRDVPKEELIGEDVRQHKRTMRLATGAIVALVLLLLAAVAGAGIAMQRQAQAELAEVEAVTARGTAEAARVEAETQEQIALSRQLAAQGLSERTGSLDRRLLLALEANRLNPKGVDARGSLLTLLQESPQLEAFLRSTDGNTIYDLEFVGDDRTLVVGTSDGEIVYWDTVLNRPISRTEPGQYYEPEFAIRPDGKQLAAAQYTDDNGGQAVAIFTAPQLQPISLLPSPRSDLGWDFFIHNLAFSPDGRLLAAARGLANASTATDEVGDIVLWDVTTGQQLGEPVKAHGSAVRSVAFSPDGKTLASGGHTGGVMVWDVVTRGETVTLEPAGEPLAINTADDDIDAITHNVAFSPDGAFLAAAGWRRVGVWDIANGRAGRERFGEQPGEVFGLAISADSQTVATTDDDGLVRLWDLRADELTAETLPGHSRPTEAVAFSRHGRTLATGDSEGAVALWDLERPSRIAPVIPGDFIAVSPSGRLLVGNEGTKLILVDAASGATLQTLGADAIDRALRVRVRHRPAYFSPDDTMLATIPETGPISLWDTATGERRGELATDGDEAFTSLAFSRDGDMVATGDEDGTVLLWDLATLTPIGAPLGKHDNFVQALAFSPDGKTLVSTAWSGPTFVWDTETRMPLGRIDPGESIPADVRFSPDDARIVLIGNDGAIHEWDRVSLQLAGEPMNGGVGPLWTAAYSPDGQTLASVGYAGQVVLWDVAEREQIGEPLLAPGGDVASLAFRPDGSTLVAVDGEDQAIAFAVSVEDWTAYACAIANRNLTQEEWDQYLGERPYHQTCPDTPVPAPVDVPATPVVPIAG